jgi:glutamate racemase
MIGVLDSGIGGLSVLREIHRLLPVTPTLYFADQGHLPYGPRPAAEIHRYVMGITRFLTERGARMIVIACHSASAASLHPLREAWPGVPFVGIEPAVKPAAQQTKSGVLGVLTTEATANGPLFRSVVERFARDIRVEVCISPELVWLAETGRYDTPEADAIVRAHVEPLLAAGADQLVLACTHFPFLTEAIRRVTSVALVDPGPAVARQTARLLPSPALSGPNRYFTTGDPARFSAMIAQLTGVTGANVASVDVDLIGSRA